MLENPPHYIDGAWRTSVATATLAVVNPANGERLGNLTEGHEQDVGAAVAAAKRALPIWAAMPRTERLQAITRLREGVAARQDEFAKRITSEMGCPAWLSRAAQVGGALAVTDRLVQLMVTVPEDEVMGRTRILYDPIGVVGAITPWNFPLMQIMAKIVPSLGMGCTVVLKPSEITPLDAALLAQVIHESQFPAGVFNLVQGSGSTVGRALAAHPDVNMISFTGSTRAGRLVAAAGAATLKKVSLELGGKSANVVLPDADYEAALPAAIRQCWLNSGQVCASLTRLLVPRSELARVEERLATYAKEWTVGDPSTSDAKLGPLASFEQQERVAGLIRTGLGEGARLIAGGAEKPAGLEHGAYVQPTILSNVQNSATVAREEIFGPVLCVLPYDGEEQALAIANDSNYGLYGGVWSADPVRAEQFARRMATGGVSINGTSMHPDAPFGGVKQSGLGREYGRHGIMEFVQTKALNGAG